MTARVALRRIAVLRLWAIAVSVVGFLVVFPHVDGWAAVGAQALLYAAMVLPVPFLRPPVRIRAGLGRRSAVVGAVLLVASVLFAALVLRETAQQGLRHAGTALSAGVGEEAIRDRLGVLLRSRAGRVTAGALLFTAAHLPVELRDGTPALLAVVLITGLVLGAVREATGGIGLPAMVHVAVDLSS